MGGAEQCDRIWGHKILVQVKFVCYEKNGAGELEDFRDFSLQ